MIIATWYGRGSGDRMERSMRDDGSAVKWVQSSYCDTAACVEVARTVGGVLVRDGAGAGDCWLSFPAEPWMRFVDSLKVGSGRF